MSHSSLSAQLASLHSKNTTSSRQHDDAVGRGFHHSANSGHSIIDGSTKHKPTVLHADSRAAAHADIPFTIMRDNGVVSLQYLCQNSSMLFDLSNDALPWQTLFGSKSVKYERGINNQETNAKFDGMVKEALYLLSTCWGDVSSSIATSPNILIQVGANVPSSVLHIIEYLIQKFYAHVYNSETLLLAFLPHHETFLFDRIIQLIDLAQLPQWAFLRPYSAAKGVIGVPRTVIAKWAASTRNNGSGAILIKKICELAKRGAKIQSLELQHSSDDGKEVRRGLSLIISFSVAVLAESLHIQYKTIGTIDESTLRCLVPYILSAIEPSSSKSVSWSIGARCSEWRAFGYVIISLIVEKCDLSADLFEAFMVGIIRGGIESVEFYKKEHYDLGSILNGNGDNDKYDYSAVQSLFDSCTDSLIALASISSISNNKREHKKVERGQLSSYLPSTKLNEYIGCSLSLRCFKSLMKVPSLHLMLGYLFQEKRLNVSHLIGAISAMSICSVASDAVQVNEVNSYLKTQLLLISEPLLSDVWRHNGSALSSALASFLILRIEKSTEESTFRLLCDVLSALHSIDSTGCDIGIAHAITSESSRTSEFDSEKSQVIKSLLNAGGVYDFEMMQGMKCKDASADQAEINSFDRLLPPRVCLEHQNPKLRLSAISTLVSNQLDCNLDDTVEALFRRYTYDDIDSVALAAGEGLMKLLLDRTISNSIFLRVHILNDTLSSLRKAHKSIDLPLFTVALNLSECAIEVLKEYVIVNEDLLNHSDDDLYQLFDKFLITMVSYIDSSVNLCVVATTLCKLLGEKKAPKSTISACVDICRSAVFHKFLRRCMSIRQIEPEKDLMNLLLFFTNTTSTMSMKDFNDDIVSVIIDVCAYVFFHYDDHIDIFTTSMKNSLNLCCQLLAKQNDIERISEMIRCVTSVQSNSMFITISSSCMHHLKKCPSYITAITDIICSTNSPVASVLHSVDLVKEYINEEEMTPIIFISIISLLGHADLTIRKLALEFISFVEVKGNDDLKSAVVALRTACDHKSQHSNILMDGSSNLPNLFANAVGPEDSKFRIVLLKGCSAVVEELTSAGDFSLNYDGIFLQISNILSAIECAGELSFPLLLRWSECGRLILTQLLNQNVVSEIPVGLSFMIDNVIKMLKGVKVVDQLSRDSVVISTGPNTAGRRNRSYSTGTVDEITTLESYPSEMKDVVLMILSEAIKSETNSFIMQVCDVLNRRVLSGSSWVDSVFSGLDSKSRENIAMKLLRLRCEKQLESAGYTLKMLPLSSNEFLYALKSCRIAEESHDLLVVTILCDCIKTRAPHLSKDKTLSQLISFLYDQLSNLSRHGTISDKGSDYTRMCIIHALIELTHNVNKILISKKLEKDVASQCQLLVSLLGASSNNIKPLVSNRSKSICLKLLTELCASAPTLVVESFIPAMICVISSKQANVALVRDTLNAIIPAFCKHAVESDFKLFDLIRAYIDEMRASDVPWNEKRQLLSQLHDSLLSSVEDQFLGQVSASVLAAYIACEAVNFIHVGFDAGFIDEESPIRLVKSVLSEVVPAIQIGSSLHLLHTVENMFSLLTGSPLADQKRDFFSFGMNDILDLFSVTEKQNHNKTLSLMWSTTTVIQLVNTIYATPAVKRAIRCGDDFQARICLNIWQELMTLQCAVTSIQVDFSPSESSIKTFWVKVGAEMNVAVSSLQSLLPVPHFLASISSIVNNLDMNVDIKRRAILLFSERACETDPASPESVLFLDMLPDMINLVNAMFLLTETSKEVHGCLLLSQSSLRAIDNFVKHFGLGGHDDQLLKKRFSVFNSALETVTNCISAIANNISFHDSDKDATTKIQVLGAAALCASSLVSLLKAKCVSILPKLVNPIVQLLKSSNRFKKESSQEELDSSQSVLFVQVSTLRMILTLSETVPQFFVSYLGTALSVDGLPSRYLRISNNTEDDAGASSLVERLGMSLSTRIPGRQLLPVLSKATSECLSSEDSFQESMVLLKMMKMSIDNAQRSDISAMAGKILHSLLKAYSIESNVSTRLLMVEAANNTLLSMVLKLSEAQLRPLYSKLREWRGDSDENYLDDTSASKRYAFWSLSALMAKELRSLFLPCMSSVVGDIIKELEYASAVLCSKISKGAKRQKVLNVTDDDATKVVGPLQSVLLCLESSLKADAYEGGNWIRSDEGERYMLILKPLGKLLSAELPQNTVVVSSSQKIDSNVSPYHRLVQGIDTEDHGNVVGCLSALATAVGNEQLWKPLNHVLLEACGNRNRSDVRKSGVKTLLSIIHSLGEEYMVLLPECLPILSELLEDEDEDIVAIARECVQQGEELLGESLEDSLK